MQGDLYSYAEEKNLQVKLSVNGVEKKPQVKEGYMILDKQSWRKGDKIEVVFDMAVRKVVADEQVKANQGKTAFERGPIVYCAEEIDNSTGVFNLDGIPRSSFEYVFDAATLNGVGKIIGKSKADSKKTTLVAIPYYAWAHREVGAMAVWLNVK